MKKLFILLFLVMSAYAQKTETFTSNTTWTVPTGVTSVQIECWGSGGDFTNGGAWWGAGAGAGAYAKVNAFTVSAGQTYSIVVATHGQRTTKTSFNSTTCVAANGWNGGGGYPGQGGLNTESSGDVTTSGGTGQSPQVGTSGGKGGDSPNGGTGGAGGAYINPGKPGNAPGGGAGGDGYYSYAYVNGADGQVKLTYTIHSTLKVIIIEQN